MNSVTLVGRLTKDPGLKKTESGHSVCNMRLAIDDIYSKEDRADFFDITVWGKQAEHCERYLRKGAMVGIEGKLRSDSYTDANGKKHYPVTINANRVQFLTWPTTATQNMPTGIVQDGAQDPRAAAQAEAAASQAQAAGSEIPI